MRIPIKAVREFGRKWNLNHVIILGHYKYQKQKGGRTHVLSWGRSTEESGQAADFANTLKTQLGWPESVRAQPSRVMRLQMEIEDLKNELARLRVEKLATAKPVDCIATKAIEGEKRGAR